MVTITGLDSISLYITESGIPSVKITYIVSPEDLIVDFKEASDYKK